MMQLYVGSQQIMQQDKITAKAWILIDADKGTYIRGCNINQNRQFASLAKMYTLYACLNINKMLKINPNTSVVKVFDTGLGGTLAHLACDQYIRLTDLYYGLMLPSGNDAASILASYYGSWLVRAVNQNGPPKVSRKDALDCNSNHSKLFSKKFIQYLNKVVVKEILNHKYTKFENPHGLSDKNQVSNVQELAQACFKFLKNTDFSKIVNCSFYSGRYHQSDETFEWQNTNILLHQGYCGIKTGITNTAGGCLSSLTTIQVGKYEYKDVIIVVLGCVDVHARFSDTKEILKEYQKYLKMMKI